ncbi:helix-turn-helix protein [Chitinophaga polysaccharea]|uniref:Helix-turn-helix protein n=1 Tax=Chitinophaga polysaccharea TaxID=1293035 RepID=A0A561P738_9BACT|nr:AraC family transcriptional regulator [Chitinophaga polysaccharea]TWF33911.1 helix-turn-helix protein [Chitinophaga polysaccharea]
MGARNLHTPFELTQADMSAWDVAPKVYYFFEIMQIREGSGFRIINQNRLPYDKGSIFLFTPQDCRGFEVGAATEFVSIRFSELFMGLSQVPQQKARLEEWLRQLEYLFFAHNRQGQLQIRHTNDCRMIASLIDNMVEEYEHKPPYYQDNLQHYVTLLLNIVARNVAEDVNLGENTAESSLINRLVAHIRQHIYQPELLKQEYLASVFHLSSNYIGEFFKKQTGESLQQYIVNYKLNLVQLRVTHSDLTIGEIADELGFTDESHMSRLFKKYHGLTPAAYRREKMQDRKNMLEKNIH